MKKRADEESRHVALLHQLSERLTAAGNYVRAAQRQPGPAAQLPADILERALAQLEQADEIVGYLRKAREGPSHGHSDAGRSYRVCFMNRFARGSNMITTCQRSIVIPSAGSPEAAIEAAKQRFAELEGIRDWQIHASFIEAGLIEDAAAAGCETHEKTHRP